MATDLTSILGSPALSNLFAGVALGVSVYALIRTRSVQTHERRIREQEHAVANVQEELSRLQLERERREADAASRADVGARFVNLGKHRQRLRVFNKGRAPAYGLEIHFPEGNPLLAESDIESKFPVEMLESGDSFDLLSTAAIGSPPKMTVELRWQEDDGTSQRKVIQPIR